MPKRPSSLNRARVDGFQAAAREHARLRTDQSKPVDIFGIIEQAGIWLMFQPLRPLYGAYAREGAVAGIIVNSNHPLSAHRFTAAHEYGHHVLGHDPVVDYGHDVTAIWGALDPSEAAAQAFAANFLMPLRLVDTMLRQLGLPPDPGELSPSQVDLLSLNLGSIYPATVNHLRTLGKITAEVATTLRKQKPKDIKFAIGRGERPPQLWADTWQVSSHEAGRTLYPKVDDVLHVFLPEAPSTGYLWSVDEQGIIDAAHLTEGEMLPPSVYLSIERSGFEGAPPVSDQDGGMRLGAGGTRHLVFRALRSGQFTLRLQKRRPWEPGEAAEAFDLNLSISPAGAGGTEQGLSRRQWPRRQQAA